jgi:hypothetical protein
LVAVNGEDWWRDGEIFDIVKGFADAAPNFVQYYAVSWGGASKGEVSFCVIAHEGVSEDDAVKAWNDYLAECCAAS